MIKLRIVAPLAVILLSLIYCGCSKDSAIVPPLKESRRIIILVVDGARYNETWGEPSHQFIPHRSALLANGTMCSYMYNNGYTYTSAGHTAITTGVYQALNNGGLELPQQPSFLQYWLSSSGNPSTDAWIITTKDKLEVLADCQNPSWHTRYRPSTDCGISGLGSGYREDDETYQHLVHTMGQHHPQVIVVNFKQPDAAGHSGDSLAYLQGITDTDNLVNSVWQQIQSDPFYRDKTDLFVTNDHGRHTPGHLDGFISHGDNCEGCRHIEFFAIGPDVKKDYISSVPFDQVDIAATAAALLKIDMPTSSGEPMLDIFEGNKIP